MANCEEYNYGKGTPARTCCGVEVIRITFTAGPEWQIHRCNPEIIRYSWNKEN